MDLLDLTLHHYQRLAPPAGLAPTKEVSGALEGWLASSVSRLAHELFERAEFRELANWPLTAFAYGANTPQRLLLSAVDSAVVKFAHALLRLAKRPAVTQLLLEAEAKRPCPAETWLTCGHLLAGTTPGIAAVETIARRPWLDLAAPEEYFHPARQLYTLENEPRLEQFDVFASPQLPRFSDYITRSIFLRIEFWQAQLASLCEQCVMALSLWGDVDLLKETLQARTTLESSVHALTAACLSAPEFPLRENAITLVHVYNAHAPAPRLEWLALPGDSIEAARGCTRLLIRRHGVCDMAAIEQVVHAVIGMTSIYRGTDAGRSKLSRAISTKRLVLADSPRNAYWDSQRIEANWERKTMLWELLWELASQARLGLSVDRNNLSNKRSLRAIRDRRSDLGKLLPAALNDLIVSAGRYSYRLELPDDAIALLVHEGDELTEEEGASLDAKLLAAMRSRCSIFRTACAVNVPISSPQLAVRCI